VRPQPGIGGAPQPTRAGAAAPGLRAPELLHELRARTASVSPTALEDYLQCAFQYFGRRMLRLTTAPPRPDRRLDFMTQGNIIHQVLRLWYEAPQDVVALFGRVFAEKLEEERIPRGYHVERLRNSMLDDLKAFVADRQWPRQGWHSRLEQSFGFALDDGLEIRGKMDRLDVADDGRAYVFDYKYSTAQSTKGRRESELLLQAPLYFMAAERCFGARPEGMFYIGVKAGVAYHGWSAAGLLDADPLPEDWIETATERTLRAVAEIRGGRVEVAPADAGKCRLCECRDICRVSVRQAQAIAEGA
jgi:ATP-dependent helicase/DNAse subunit B